MELTLIGLLMNIVILVCLVISMKQDRKIFNGIDNHAQVIIVLNNKVNELENELNKLRRELRILQEKNENGK